MRCGWQVFHWSLITSDLISVTRVSLSLQSCVERVENKGQRMNVCVRGAGAEEGAALENRHVYERLGGASVKG